MSEISDRFRRRAQAFTDRVEAVPPYKWESQSPCEDWKAVDIIDHMVGNAKLFLGFIDLELPDAPPASEDPVVAWESARDAVQAALDDPTTAGQEFDGMMGRTTFEQAVDRFAGMDLVIHAWDLARATDGDERLDPDDVHAIFEQAQPMDEMLRSPGVCKARIEVAPDADEQTQLLAFLGRRT